MPDSYRPPIYVPIPAPSSGPPTGIVIFIVLVGVGLVAAQLGAIERAKELDAKLTEYQRTIAVQIERAHSRDRLVGAIARKVGMTPAEIRKAWRGVEPDVADGVGNGMESGEGFD
jgi:hypothetical protein